MAKRWSGNNRAPWHDYTQRQIYHITLKKSPEAMAFGMLAGDWRLNPGTTGSSYIQASPLGRIIKGCLREISAIYPALRIYQYALMPDHLHLILSVESTLDEILGRKLAAFKVMVNKRSGISGVFEKGFNDQILTTTRNLNQIYTYLRDNPRRLAVRRANPDFFTRLDSLSIGGAAYQAYGNVQLLDNPFKEQVIVHRADTPEQFVHQKKRWLYTAANDGVLVSPFISKREKEIRTEAETLGATLILITHEAFGERCKPAAHDFDLCREGRLLIITLGLVSGTPLTRDICQDMNTLAETIVNKKAITVCHGDTGIH
ncbi:MAG: hypothetical protein K2K37_05770 [Muribaculaceae bacterium]|nr:hypothetical protein [Muribaculaceae bacterium]